MNSHVLYWLKALLVTLAILFPTSLQGKSLLNLDSTIADEKLSGTYEHPFWDAQSRQWVEMGTLQAGQKLHLLDGSPTYVLSNKHEDAPAGETFTTYNFEVEDFHTYFVGESGVWVHNAGRACELAFSTWRNLFEKHTSVAVSYRQLHKIQKRKSVNQGAREDTVWGLVQKDGEIDKLKVDGKLDADFVQLGTENGIFDPREAFVADRFKLQKNKNLVGRSDQGADFVERLPDGTLRHWDAKGPFPREFIDGQMDTILEGFSKHYRDHGAAKNEFLVVDFAGLKPSAKQRMLDRLQELDPAGELYEILDNL